MSRFRYPVDTDQFQEIREQGKLYVEVLRPCIEEYAENLEITVDEAYALLKKNYDGYHFSPKSKDVYAPFSLLRALDGKGYAIPYEAEGKVLVKCGVSISSEHRNITHWRITDADGKVIDEQNF